MSVKPGSFSVTGAERDHMQGSGADGEPREPQVTQVAPLGWIPGRPTPQSPSPYGAPQYGAPPPPQQYGAPRPGNGAPASGGDGALRRPGTVTAAAVIAFVVAGLILLAYGLALLALVGLASQVSSRAGAGATAIALILVLLGLAIGVLFLWGGVSAVRGSGRTLLVVVSTIELVLAVGWTALSLFGIGGASIGAGWLVRVFLDVVLVVPILILILQPSSTNFFRSRRGVTN
jgi:hypothetical protein